MERRRASSRPDSGDQSDEFQPAFYSNFPSTLPTVGRHDINYAQRRQVASTLTQSSLGHNTYETPLTPQSPVQTREKPQVTEAPVANGNLRAALENLQIREQVARPAKLEESVPSSQHSSTESHCIEPGASRLTDASLERDSDRARTMPSFVSKESKWTSRTQHAGTNILAAVYDQVEQESVDAWQLSRLRERVSSSGISPTMLTEFIGSQFQTDEIPAVEEVMAVIEQILARQ
ncbi:MAG: hypothetical protein M1821_007204 [Bathelium mastoideum]|nr:MAG: hypothetical protein M1821_007204 [Bathelium mastoideum]